MYNDKSYKRKKLKKLIDLYGTLKMRDFLQEYVGVTTQLNYLEKATHRDIKFLGFEYVMTVSFDDIDNDDLALGNILFVEDYKHHIGAYRNPLRISNNNSVLINKNYKKNVRRRF